VETITIITAIDHQADPEEEGEEVHTLPPLSVPMRHPTPQAPAAVRPLRFLPTTPPRLRPPRPLAVRHPGSPLPQAPTRRPPRPRTRPLRPPTRVPLRPRTTPTVDTTTPRRALSHPRLQLRVGTRLIRAHLLIIRRTRHLADESLILMLGRCRVRRWLDQRLRSSIFSDRSY